MRSTPTVSFSIHCVLLLLTLGLAGPPALAQERVLETHHAAYYGGFSVTAERTSSGELRAFVARKENGRSFVEAELRYDLAARTGSWRSFDRAGLSEATESFDFRNRDRVDTEALLARQTVQSIALAALLLWEDHHAGSIQRLGARPRKPVQAG